MLRLAFLALPFQMCQRNRSTSSTMAAFACTLLALSANQAAGRLRRVLKAHCEVEPIEDGWCRDPGVDQDGPKTGAAVRESGHYGCGGSASHVKFLTEQGRNIGVRLGHRCEHLPGSASRFDISDADLQMPLVLFATADEGRINADGDRCCRPRRCGLV